MATVFLIPESFAIKEVLMSLLETDVVLLVKQKLDGPAQDSLQHVLSIVVTGSMTLLHLQSIPNYATIITRFLETDATLLARPK